jgi:hypothetical protein
MGTQLIEEPERLQPRTLLKRETQGIYLVSPRHAKQERLKLASSKSVQIALHLPEFQTRRQSKRAFFAFCHQHQQNKLLKGTGFRTRPDSLISKDLIKSGFGYRFDTDRESRAVTHMDIFF